MYVFSPNALFNEHIQTKGRPRGAYLCLQRSCLEYRAPTVSLGGYFAEREGCLKWAERAGMRTFGQPLKMSPCGRLADVFIKLNQAVDAEWLHFRSAVSTRPERCGSSRERELIKTLLFISVIETAVRWRGA